MAVDTIRHALHQLIEKTEDETILIEVLKILGTQDQVNKTDWYDLISAEEKAAIEESMAQADRGEVLSHNEVMKKYKKWL